MSIKYGVQIDCGNAAFDEDQLGIELARILRAEADRLECESGSTCGAMITRSVNLRDINGNKVGEAALYVE